MTKAGVAEVKMRALLTALLLTVTSRQIHAAERKHESRDNKKEMYPRNAII
jgi:hypothetical protein